MREETNNPEDRRPEAYQFQTEAEFGDEKLSRHVANVVSEFIRYDPYRREVYRWNGIYWEPSTDNHLETVTRDAINQYRKTQRAQFESEHGPWNRDKQKALRDKDDPLANAMAQANEFAKTHRVKQIAANIKSDPALMVEQEIWDKQPWLLGVLNGVVDLKTGDLLDPDPDLFITRSTSVPYIKGAKSELWDKTLLDIMDGDAKMVDYIQRLFGYIATGTLDEALFAIFHGTIGRNGKDTIVEAVMAALGTYAKAAPEGLLIKSRSERHRQEILEMARRRLYVTSETPKGVTLHSSRVKQFSGSHTLTGEIKGGREVTFQNQTTHLMTVNELPHYDLNDQALGARARVVPFTITFRHPSKAMDGDRVANLELKRLVQTDEEILQAVLAWVVEGAVKYGAAEEGLAPPQKVVEATNSYQAGNWFASDDSGLAAWMNDNTSRKNASVRVNIQHLFSNYQDYAEHRGVPNPITNTMQFGKELAALGIQKVATQEGTGPNRTTVTYVVGLELTLTRAFREAVAGGAS